MSDWISYDNDNKRFIVEENLGGARTAKVTLHLIEDPYVKQTWTIHQKAYNASHIEYVTVAGVPDAWVGEDYVLVVTASGSGITPSEMEGIDIDIPTGWTYTSSINENVKVFIINVPKDATLGNTLIEVNDGEDTVDHNVNVRKGTVEAIELNGKEYMDAGSVYDLYVDIEADHFSRWMLEDMTIDVPDGFTYEKEIVGNRVIYHINVPENVPDNTEFTFTVSTDGKTASKTVTTSYIEWIFEGATEGVENCYGGFERYKVLVEYRNGRPTGNTKLSERYDDALYETAYDASIGRAWYYEPDEYDCVEIPEGYFPPTDGHTYEDNRQPQIIVTADADGSLIFSCYDTRETLGTGNALYLLDGKPYRWYNTGSVTGSGVWGETESGYSYFEYEYISGSLCDGCIILHSDAKCQNKTLCITDDVEYWESQFPNITDYRQSYRKEYATNGINLTTWAAPDIKGVANNLKFRLKFIK